MLAHMANDRGRPQLVVVSIAEPAVGSHDSVQSARSSRLSEFETHRRGADPVATGKP